MRRFLLCLLLLPLATSSFGQVAVQLQASDGNLYGASGTNFYSFNPTTDKQTILNSSVSSPLTLCLERSDGTLLGISKSGQAMDVTLTGDITAIATFPSVPACPAIANDGNYYGSASSGGDYGCGYLYQLTSSGELNIFFNFVCGGINVGSNYSPIQGSDGNLYWYNNGLLQRYSPKTGETATTLPNNNSSGPLLEASDGNFYALIASVDGVGGSVVQITPKGAASSIYTPFDAFAMSDLFLTGSTVQPLAVLVQYDYFASDPNDGCYANGNFFPLVPLSLSGDPGTVNFSLGVDEADGDDANGDEYTIASMLFGGNGDLYAAYTDYNQTDGSTGGEQPQCDGGTSTTAYNETFSTGSVAPITITLNKTHVKPGGTATATWQVTNAYSDTLQQCFGFGGLSGKLALSGSATVTAPSSAGSYVSSIVCGGTEVGFATLTAGNATMTLASSAAQVNQGTPFTLTATITNPGTPAPTGTVSFLYGSTVIGSAPVNNSVGTFTASTAGVPAGSYSVVASYPGDSNYGPATSAPVTVTIEGKAATSTVLTPASQSVLHNANVSLTATVNGSSTHGAPSGTVKFMSGSTVIATGTLKAQSSTASAVTIGESTVSVAPGKYTVMATYGGDGYNLPSSSGAVTVTVEDSTPVALTISPNPVAADASFTLTATINGKDNPSGTLEFYVNGTQNIASANVSNSVAQVTVEAGTLTSGTYSVTAYYAGDANNPTGTSPAVSLTVQ